MIRAFPWMAGLLAALGGGPGYQAPVTREPRRHNGGQRSGAAAIKRQARKRRNVRLHPRCAG